MALPEVFLTVSCWPAVTVTLAGLKPASVYSSTTAFDCGVPEAAAAGEADADGLAAVALGDGLAVAAGEAAGLRVAK